MERLQNLIEALPRCTNEVTKLFVGDFDAAFSDRIRKLRNYVVFSPEGCDGQKC
jgi:hypothetical protein